jgi:hypothetical protein
MTPARKRVLSRHGVLLEWVLDGGEPHHVSEYAALKPRLRPALRCPECDQLVVAKLGGVRRHHAAHVDEGRPCATSNPETALHLNTKCYIAAQLQQGIGGERPLRIREQCLVGDVRASRDPSADVIPWEETEVPRCEETNERVWCERWDEVLVEYRVAHKDSVRVPDIALKKSGELVGAIEVFVHHAVSPDKAATLDALGVPWLEVRGDETVWLGDAPWTIALALPLHREGPSRPWRCEPHQQRHDVVRQYEQRALAEERERARHTETVVAAKVVDVLYPTGRVYRRVYEVRASRTDGIDHQLALMCGDTRLGTVALQPGHDARAHAKGRRALLAAYAHDERLYATRGRLDSPMGWARGPLAELVASEGPWDTTATHSYPLVTRYPRRWVWVEKRKEWWCPADMKAVRWDRPDDDPFDVHPAWARRKEQARARAQGGATRVPRVASPTSPPEAAGARKPPAVPSSEGAHQEREAPTTIALPAISIFDRSPVPLAAHVDAAEFGDAVERVTHSQSFDLLELHTVSGQPRRALLLVKAAVTESVLAHVCATLEHEGLEVVWLSARYDWSCRFGDHPWLMLARGQANRSFVVFGRAVIPVAEFSALFAAGDEHLSLAGIRRVAREVAKTLPV